MDLEWLHQGSSYPLHEEPKQAAAATKTPSAMLLNKALLASFQCLLADIN